MLVKFISLQCPPWCGTIQDPKAERNIRLQEPERYAEMIGRLKPLLEPRGLGSAPVETSFFEEAIENLKALGDMH